ncbi:MAG TPA: alpha/beta hydrolase-fold protein [Ramlibacter sp.]|nr:alpha/beta hydrolase-fold protein [Ramlibacter sp.]
MKLLVRALCVVLAALLCACGGGGGGGTNVPPPAQIGRTEALSVMSASTGYTYPINVYLPPQYDANASAHLPVIFAVDGDAQFGYDNNGTRFDALRTALQQRGTAAILVGVGGTVRRNTDFLPPGSLAYHTFLTQELVPAIDARYRTDTAKRILSGLSYGGTIVFFAFAYEGAGPVTFRQFWSTETSPVNIAGQLEAAEAQLHAAAQGKTVPVTLFLAGATSAVTNGVYVDSLYQLVLSHHYTGLDVEEVMYATSHVGADLPAFNEAITRFLQ